MPKVIYEFKSLTELADFVRAKADAIDKSGVGLNAMLARTRAITYRECAELIRNARVLSDAIPQRNSPPSSSH